MPARPAERRLRAVSTSVDVGPQEAAEKAWGMLAEVCDRALVVRGLDDEDTAALREIRQSAAEIAGIPPARAVGGPGITNGSSTEPKGAA